MAISPTGVVGWATYYGGSRSERGRAVAINANGQLVFAGQTFSPNLPVLRATQQTTGGNRDTFVVQLDPPWTAFSYATYLGGSNNDEGSGVAIDAVGRVFVDRRGRVSVTRCAGRVGCLRLRPLDGRRRSRHRRRRHERRLGDAVRPGSARQRCGGRSRRRRRHQRPGTGEQHAPDRLSHPLPGGGRDRQRSSTIAWRSSIPGAALATVLLRYQREGNPELQQLLALPAHSAPHRQSGDDRRTRERVLLDRDRKRSGRGRRPHDDVGRAPASAATPRPRSSSPRPSGTWRKARPAAPSTSTTCSS